MNVLHRYRLFPRTPELEVEHVDMHEILPDVYVDLYRFVGNSTCDLARVEVVRGAKTPLYLLVDGERTIERYQSGTGTLEVIENDGWRTVHHFPKDDGSRDVVIEIGETIQWHATGSDLVYDELCWPPYEAGRFENIG